MDKRFIIFLGAPGAGKGTQAATVAGELKLAHIATGDLFRQAQTQGTELALKAKSYMDKGALVPDEITIQMVLERISAPDCQAGVIFDGFPRNVKQAEALDKALAELGEAITEVVQIKVSEEREPEAGEEVTAVTSASAMADAMFELMDHLGEAD